MSARRRQVPPNRIPHQTSGLFKTACILTALAAAAHAQPTPQPTPAPEPTARHSLAPPDIPADDPRPPTGIEEELEQIRPGLAIKRKFDDFAERTNLRLGIANTYLFQQATAGPGRRTAASGDLDLLAKWTAIGAGTKDTGLLAASAEYRYQIGDQPPSELGGQIGTLIPTTNSFSERPVVIKEVYWDQRLFEDRFRFALGRIDPENLFGGHRLQSANTYFLYKAFSGNPVIAYPGPGIAAAAQVKPVPWFYLTGGITDANGKATIGNFEGFFEDHEYLLFSETGITPTIDGVGEGRYRLAVWHIDEREDAQKPSDAGFTLSFDQDIRDSLTAFTRYSHADGDVTNITDSIQAGVAIKHVLGDDNILGLAAAWSRPKDGADRDEKALEVFQRFQLTETTQFTVGAEVIFDPSNAPGDDVLGVFSARIRFSF
ncbi:MAG: carbohydrate porin [Phycisphaerales bacterium]|nr:carbohydrate porin [Phycisphaerales bacterium]